MQAWIKGKCEQGTILVLLAVALCAGGSGCGSTSPSTGTPPAITTIAPNSAPAGGLAFTLTVSGSNFLPASQVQWNGNSRTTTFVSSTQLQAHIMAADLAAAGKVSVTVLNPAPHGGASNASTFTVPAATIAFRSARALDGSDAGNATGAFNIWVMNPDGSGVVPLTRLTKADNTITITDPSKPTWSPDGSKIAFQSTRALDGSDAANANATLNIWVMNADGSNPRPLTKITALDANSFQPAWSRDSSKIVFVSVRALDGSDATNSNGTWNIWVINADGSNPSPLTKITAVGTNSLQPAWSPDGSKIVFVSDRALDGSDAASTNFTFNMWTINADGSGATPLSRLTAVGASSSRPSFSPGGSKVVFQSQRALDGSDAVGIHFTQNIWTINLDGSGAAPVTRLTASGANNANPVWSPDGGTISFESGRALDGSDAANTNGTTNIWTVHADGSISSLTPVTKLTSGAHSFSVKWSPDGSKLIFASIRALDGSDAFIPNFVRNIWVVKADGSGATPLTGLTHAGNDFPDRP